MSDSHEALFQWPRTDANHVVLTGTFDQWSRSISLTRMASGFQGTVKIPWGQKVAYKFIVDGNWATVDGQPIEIDPAGNWNNVYTAPSQPPLVVEPLISSSNDGPESASATVVPPPAVSTEVSKPVSAVSMTVVPLQQTNNDDRPVLTIPPSSTVPSPIIVESVPSPRLDATATATSASDGGSEDVSTHIPIKPSNLDSAVPIRKSRDESVPLSPVSNNPPKAADQSVLPNGNPSLALASPNISQKHDFPSSESPDTSPTLSKFGTTSSRKKKKSIFMRIKGMFSPAHDDRKPKNQ